MSPPRKGRGHRHDGGMAKYHVNDAAVARCRELIDKRQYVLDSDWGDVQPSAEAQNAFLEKLCHNDPLLEIAKGLEEIALADDYFVERKLYPNVDFYTGLIYKAMGFESKMFTVLFAIGRLPGWIAQWREMMHDPETKIGRPRQIYTGAPERNYPG